MTATRIARPRSRRWPRPSPTVPTSSCPPSCSRDATSASTSDRSTSRWATTVEDSPAIAAVRKVTAGTGAVVPVSFFEAARPAYFNSVAVVEDGTCWASTGRPTSPTVPGTRRSSTSRPGNTGFKTWATRHGRIGVGICWDQWFPEAARAMALQGADLLLLPDGHRQRGGQPGRQRHLGHVAPGHGRPRRVQPRPRGGGQPDRHRGRPDLLRLVVHRRPPGAATRSGRPNTVETISATLDLDGPPPIGPGGGSSATGGPSSTAI